jgi:hypothetical protein
MTLANKEGEHELLHHLFEEIDGPAAGTFSISL